MATTRADRVENALQSLLARLVPQQQADEDEESADQRWEDANNFATEQIERGDVQSAPTEDVNHAADLIKRRLIHDSASPEKAAAFGNLYSRLLAQPVLSRKWAILYFLLKTAEGTEADGESEQSAEGEVEEEEEEGQPPTEVGVRENMPQVRRQEAKHDLRESRYERPSEVFDDAFARTGLSSHKPSTTNSRTVVPPPTRSISTAPP